tara:strand:+ start:1214 stop:1513 length:300 start_codon:yes stop_codon:yes gene_type:complete
MDYNSFNTQWYTLEEKDVCEININSGSVTFKDKSYNTKGLRMDSETLVGSILMSLNDLVVVNSYETSTEKRNYEILKCFKDTIDGFIKTSDDNKKKWEK